MKKVYLFYGRYPNDKKSKSVVDIINMTTFKKLIADMNYPITAHPWIITKDISIDLSGKYGWNIIEKEYEEFNKRLLIENLKKEVEK
jgi:hypothetical protein